MARITAREVTVQLERLNERRPTRPQYYAFYESGRCHVAFPVGPNGGRQTVFTGTARECFAFAQGMREVG